MQVGNAHTEEHPLVEKHVANAIFQHATVGIILANHSASILVVNSFCAYLFGYTEDELAGQRVELLIPEGLCAPRNLNGIRKDGCEFPIEVDVVDVNNEKEDLILVFVTDVRAAQKLRQLETSNLELSSELSREKELNELKSRFVSMASHEFRTPLTAILSSAILLQKYILTEHQPQRTRHISRIFSCVNNLNCILNDFLSVGRIEDGRVTVNPTEVDVFDMIDNIRSDLNNLLKVDQHLHYKHFGNHTFTIDGSLLKHIIMNLISNAIKFSPDKSVIAIRSTIADNSLTISVEDEGIGISKEDQAHLFERFYRASNAGSIQGTGLGLNIVATYVQMMKGTITCKSDLDMGTEMVVIFNNLLTSPINKLYEKTDRCIRRP